MASDKDAGPVDPVGDDESPIDQAVAAGTAAPAHTLEQPDPAVAAEVKAWWDRTAERPEFLEAVDQWVLDKRLIEAATREEHKNLKLVTVRHVYRNSQQTVALTTPEAADISAQPAEEMEPPAGSPEASEYAQERANIEGTCKVLTILAHKFGIEGAHPEKLESWVQDATHFRLAVIKVWYQDDLAEDPIAAERLPDAQDQMARFRALVLKYDRGEFTKDEAQYVEMEELRATLGNPTVEIQRTVSIELVPLPQYRCDPSVSGPEQKHVGEWERHDLPMERDTILGKWEVTPEELDRCSTFSLDDTGKWVKAEKELRTQAPGSAASNISGNQSANTPRSSKDTQWYLVTEIYDYRANKRRTLLEGLTRPLSVVDIDPSPTGRSPFVLMVLNRRSGQLYGYSDSEMQGKLQEQINRTRTDAEQARKDSRPRWAYDPAVITDPKSISAIKNARDMEMVPVAVSGKGTLKDAIVPLAGNHEFDQKDYDTNELKDEMDKSAAIPRQALGVTGEADFSSEVQVAAQGTAIQARYRGTRIVRGVKELYAKIFYMLLRFCGQDVAVKYAGKAAAQFWSADVAERLAMWQRMQVDVRVKIDQQMDYKQKSAALLQFADVMTKMGSPIDASDVGMMLGKYLGIEQDARQLIKPNPSTLVAKLAQVLQVNPTSLTPDALGMLAQLGAMAQQQEAQLLAQQAAQQTQDGAGGGGGAAPGAEPAPADGGGAPMDQGAPVEPQSIPADEALPVGGP